MPPGRVCAMLLVVVLTSSIPVQPLPSRPPLRAQPVTLRVHPPTPRQVASQPRPAPPGVVHRLEPGRSTVYTVQPGDTLWVLARRTGVSVEDLQAANGLRGDRLRIGQRLLIPGGIRAQIPAPRRVAFLWPARGTVTSRFGVRLRRHHNGIDIAARYGSPIRAVRAGVVRYRGWFGGYGRLVVIDHGGGLETWYGHAARLFVRVGQWVLSGQRIGLVGCSGACTGPHLHFEVRARGRPVDPMRYLR